ncbi:MAG: squalene--hopene cyclase [Gemmatimonadota bacterium]
MQLDSAIERARENLLSLQRSDGHWCGELEADTVLESEYILLLHFLGRSGEERAKKAAESIRRRQLPEGGWAIYAGGPPEISASVKGYFVLKLMGDPADAPHMVRARRAILELGGVEACNTYTKIYLAMFGQYDWYRCPAIPPEMMLLPQGFFFNVQAISSWSRGIFVPLSVIWAHRPICLVPPSAGIDELFVGGAPRPVNRNSETARERRWRYVFNGIDRGVKLLERSRLNPLRRRALRAAEEWIERRAAMSDGLAAIFPAMVNTVFAFRCLGHPVDHSVIRSQLDALQRHELDLGDTLRIQPALSPVWDTAQAVNTLVVTGLDPRHPALAKAARWLVSREVKHPGDWRHANPEGTVGGWYFEYANEFYPDCDDTAEVLIALARPRYEDPDLEVAVAAARKRGLRWLLSMQNEDGGWAAFDRGCDKKLLTLVPFADHNAMIDPSWEDITGRILELFGVEGMDRSHPSVCRAVDFLLERQQEDGSWFGRWGCNYIYGTWLALWGLSRVGEDMTRERYQRAADWLESRQNPDGGWGETLGTYENPSLKGSGPSTAAQTAWALLGLLATGRAGSLAVTRGVSYLLRTQHPDGAWDDGPWTGTGFPAVFYLRYHMYDDYFPPLALAAYRERLTESWSAAARWLGTVAAGNEVK